MRENSGLAALAGCGVACGVVPGLLARVEPGEFSAFVRCGGDSYLHWTLDRQRVAAIEPGGFVGFVQRRTCARRSLHHENDSLALRREPEGPIPD